MPHFIDVHKQNSSAFSMLICFILEISLSTPVSPRRRRNPLIHMTQHRHNTCRCDEDVNKVKESTKVSLPSSFRGETGQLAEGKLLFS